MENYKNANRFIVWVIALSTIAYFVFLPVSFNKPSPTSVKEASLQANPLEAVKKNEMPSLMATPSTSTEDITPILPIRE